MTIQIIVKMNGKLSDQLIDNIMKGFHKKKMRNKIMINIVEPLIGELVNKYYPYILLLFIIQILILIILIVLVTICHHQND